MLQIVTKMYFREGVPLRSTVHRRVLHTNLRFLTADYVELPVGTLAPSDELDSISAVTLSVTEHLEAHDRDGDPAVLVATSGTDLIDSLADVLSFGLNATVSRDRDLVRRLVPASLDGASRHSASRLFRSTFDPGRFVPDAEWDEFRGFMTRLLALNRRDFEAAMRAIRRIAGATRRAVDDPTIAYVDLVAALESLSAGTPAAAATWDRLDNRKQRLFDEALDDAEPEMVERVRRAVVEAERLGAKARFVSFVLDHVSRDFFRVEASDALRPVRGADFERVVKLAYDIRSRNVHVLEDLPPEVWAIGDRADTVSPPDLGVMLSLEGLARLARHIVRNFVERADAEVDRTFDWRSNLPDVVTMRVAPQYWIWQADGFDAKSADRYFAGFAEKAADVLGGHDEALPDMNAVLERIEQLLPSTRDPWSTTSMIAIYTLWHRLLAPQHQRNGAEAVLADNVQLLAAPSMPSFITGLLTDELPQWSAREWHQLATDRRAQRMRRRHLELAARFDAMLQVIAAERMLDEGRADEATTLARYAVEEIPGDTSLMKWEASVASGESADLDYRALVLQSAPEDANETPST